MKIMNLQATTRNLQLKTKQLLKESLLPAVVFGKDVKSLSLTLKKLDFQRMFKEAGESSIVDLAIEGEKEPRAVLFSEIQRNPLTGNPTHVALHQVQLKEKVTVHVPVKFIGESPAIKGNLGVLLELMDEIEVEAYPRDLPHEFVVDISGLKEVNDGIHIKDLKVDASKVEIKIAPEELIVKIDYLAKEEEPTAAEAAAATEAEAIAGVKATKELSPEEKAKREAEKKTADEKAKSKKE